MILYCLIIHGIRHCFNLCYMRSKIEDGMLPEVGVIKRISKGICWKIALNS